MIEGKIADEDFNGDPGFNALGKRGIRAMVRKSKKAKDEDDEEGEDEVCVTFMSLHAPS